jgi:RNA polymerase sigma-70 factor (ECF subfamily)
VVQGTKNFAESATRLVVGVHYYCDSDAIHSGDQRMRRGATQDVLEHLRTLYCCGVIGHQSDEQLLEQFIALRDDTSEDAFAALVRRHGPMVFGVCQRVLGNAHEAEDAFQATFLVLARKARSVIRGEKVASWLHGVAYRTAKDLRIQTGRRRAREERVRRRPLVESVDSLDHDELRSVIDQELARLPAHDRGPIVLCELEGLSRHEAARRLGVPEGTLSSRLARAKARLRVRLQKRGLVVSAATLSLAVLREATAITLPDALAASTTLAAVRIAAGFSAAKVVSTSVASLAEGVLRAMLFAKLKGTIWGLGTIGVLVSGAIVTAQDTVDRTARVPIASNADRQAAMERKLDRIISALDRLSGTVAAQPSGSRAMVTTDRPGAQQGNPATNDLDVPQSRTGGTATVHDQPRRFSSGPGPAATTSIIPDVYNDVLADRVAAGEHPGNVAAMPKLPLENRLDAAERNITVILARLDRLEHRLADLHKIVGQAGASSIKPGTPVGSGATGGAQSASGPSEAPTIRRP